MRSGASAPGDPRHSRGAPSSVRCWGQSAAVAALVVSCGAARSPSSVRTRRPPSTVTPSRDFPSSRRCRHGHGQDLVEPVLRSTHEGTSHVLGPTNRILGPTNRILGSTKCHNRSHLSVANHPGWVANSRRSSPTVTLCGMYTNEVVTSTRAIAHQRQRHLHRYVEVSCDAAPDAITLESESEWLTYRQLDERANRRRGPLWRPGRATTAAWGTGSPGSSSNGTFQCCTTSPPCSLRPRLSSPASTRSLWVVKPAPQSSSSDGALRGTGCSTPTVRPRPRSPPPSSRPVVRSQSAVRCPAIKSCCSTTS